MKRTVILLTFFSLIFAKTAVINVVNNLEGKKFSIMSNEKQIMENPQEFFTQEVLEKINEYIHEEFSYGGYTEELPFDSLDEDVLEKE